MIYAIRTLTDMENQPQTEENWPLPPSKRARYSDHIDKIRRDEYPMLQDTTYLDHAATTPAPASLLSSFAQELTRNLYGNPHSGSASSQLSTRRIDDTRLKVLRFFNADPEAFDVVFVANATAGVKLVAEALRDAVAGRSEGGDREGTKGFKYVYHNEVHTSVVGVREMAERGSLCLDGEDEVDAWIREIRREDHQQGEEKEVGPLQLLAYPAQSNMNGHRPDPQRAWCRRIRDLRQRTSKQIYTLYDAAGLVSTSPMDLSDLSNTPDFIVLSFYKLFGFPDLGALMVRKDSGEVLSKRRYFGGGTVEMVISGKQPWHSKKDSTYHDMLEDGTLPFHNIVALDLAMDAHRRLYGSMADVALHTAELAQVAIQKLLFLKHGNGAPVCQIYRRKESRYGPVIAFNLKNNKGQWIGKSEVEKLAAVRNIELRAGTLCNPGGTASYLGLTCDEMRRNFAMGQRCGDEHDLMDGRPTGVLRISFGAMSSMRDLETFLNFITEFFVEKTIESSPPPLLKLSTQSSEAQPQPTSRDYYIDSLCVFPIKSCAGYQIPPELKWQVHPEGLAWDREWCLIHQGTGSVLNQKRYPRMVNIRPEIDLATKVLRIKYSPPSSPSSASILEVPLSSTSSTYRSPSSISLETVKTNLCTKPTPSRVCGDPIQLQIYTSSQISDFFTNALDVPCTLARFPPRTTASASSASEPLSQLPSIPQQRTMKIRAPNPFPAGTITLPSSSSTTKTNQNILLSNESPILLISLSSLNLLNRQIRSFHHSNPTPNTIPKTPNLPASAFRANIIVSQTPQSHQSQQQHDVKETPYAEDNWRSLTIHSSQSSLTAPNSPSSSTTSSSLSYSSSSPLSTSPSSPSSSLPLSTSPTSPSPSPSKTQTTYPKFKILGPCRRCQMICIPQSQHQQQHQQPPEKEKEKEKGNERSTIAGRGREKATDEGSKVRRTSEPFATLAKTRRWNGGVWFGVHLSLSSPPSPHPHPHLHPSSDPSSTEVVDESDGDGDGDDLVPASEKQTAAMKGNNNNNNNNSRQEIWIQKGDLLVVDP